MSSLDSSEKRSLIAFVVFVVGLVMMVGGYILSDYNLNRYRVENGYNECQRVGSPGTVWIKGSCKGGVAE